MLIADANLVMVTLAGFMQYMQPSVTLVLV